jgi:hypothetical protein
LIGSMHSAVRTQTREAAQSLLERFTCCASDALAPLQLRWASFGTPMLLFESRIVYLDADFAAAPPPSPSKLPPTWLMAFALVVGVLVLGGCCYSASASLARRQAHEQ